MKSKTNNIETRDKLSKLVQRFDGIEDNNPPTNPIDDKKTGILYTSDYIDRTSYPDAIKPLETKYEESIADLDKLQRPGEWVYEIDLEYRFPLNPDYGFGLLNVNDFFTIKKTLQTYEICYDAQLVYSDCYGFDEFEYNNYTLDFADPVTVGATLFYVYSVEPNFLDHMQGFEVNSSNVLDNYASIPGPYYLDILSGPVAAPGGYQWEVHIVDDNGNIVSNNAIREKEPDKGFCVVDRFDILLPKEIYPTIYLEIGDVLSGFSFGDCGYSFPPGIWTITNIQESFVKPLSAFPGFWLITIEDENGNRPYYDFKGCKGSVCFNKVDQNPTYNNDVRGYIKSVEEIVESCVSPMGLFSVDTWSDEGSINEYIKQFANVGIQYDSLPNQCCTRCDPYFIGSLKALRNWLEYTKKHDITPCCFNIKTHAKPFGELAQQLNWYCDGVEHNCCDTNFVECADQVLSIAPDFNTYMKWLDRGIVEYSQLSDVSHLCYLYDFAMTIPVEEYRIEFINAMLEFGLVIVCDGAFTYFYGIDAYIKTLDKGKA